ncbi:hypothetical protein [Phormidium sp. CCY1219]|uniref:hypothetical protein n=1 Tax=Phormidium sp. CCY1219 TaxID=2886104 RepID=UPI002D1EA43E|nr:hypothetical protein [Phormidium sp. CCY1219]MEB3828749.1 hypothetical protein [Phormidium sp. CCY1219]
MSLLLSIFAADPSEKERFLETFKRELAVEPYELIEILKCTKTERKRWIKEGKIPVLEYRSCRKSGKILEYPVHDRRVVMSLTPEEIQQWRDSHQARVAQTRKSAAKAASHSRKENQQARQNFAIAWEQIRAKWQETGSPEIAATLELAYWTVWGSRWAKENQLKGDRAIKYGSTYETRKHQWYALKTEAVRLLSQTPYAILSFYRPPEADKIFLRLCDEHSEEMREFECFDKWEFFYLYSNLVKKCPACWYNEETDYYSLYELEVKTAEFPEFTFSFHIPYPVGQAFWPLPNKLPQIERAEQDGIFRFGRPLLDREKVIHREGDVWGFLQGAIANFKTQFVFPKKPDMED